MSQQQRFADLPGQRIVIRRSVQWGKSESLQSKVFGFISGGDPT